MKTIGQLLAFAVNHRARKAVLARQEKDWWAVHMDWEPEDVDQFCDRLVLLVILLMIALAGSWAYFLFG